MVEPHKKRSPAQGRGPSELSTTTKESRMEIIQATGPLERRRSGAHRLPPFDCGHSDPFTPGHRRTYPSAKSIDGYRDALEHLADLGLIGAPIMPELRELWQRGGDDRRLAQTVAQSWEIAA